MRRRDFLLTLATASLAGAAHADLLPVPQKDDKGFYVHDWLRPTTGDLRGDLALATAEGKALAIFWEMSPCPFCKILHEDALRDPTLNDYVAHKFRSVRLDIRSNEALIDFNGAHRTQSDARLAHRVLGTPTLAFHVADGREVARMPGYLGYNSLRATIEYVDQGGYKQGNLLTWLRQRAL